MLKEHERWFLFYDCFLKPSPDDAPRMSIMEIMTKLEGRQGLGESVKMFRNNTAAMRINDFRIDENNNIAFMLIQYADKSAADPVFGNLETGELRTEPKLEGEGIAVSAHLAISLTPTIPRGESYTTLLEDIPGITKSNVSPFLTSEFKEGCQVPYENELGERKIGRAISQFSAHPSLTLQDDLQRGRLTAIELIQQSVDESQFDEEGYTKETRRKIDLKVRRPYQGAEAVTVINLVRRKANRLNYAKMRIQYKRFEGRQPQKSETISTNREDAVDKLFARYEMITTVEALPQCLEGMHDEMTDAMAEYILQERAASRT